MPFISLPYFRFSSRSSYCKIIFAQLYPSFNHLSLQQVPFFGGGAYFSVAGKPCMPVSNGQSTNVVLQLAILHLNYNSAKVN